MPFEKTAVSNLDEVRLLEQARAWDERALLEIYDAFRPGLYRYAYRLLGQAEAAEECVAEVFARFLVALRRGKGPKRSLRAYLYRMVHNWAQDRFRERDPHVIDEHLERMLQTPQGTPEDAALRRERAERLRAALHQLPPRQAQVLALRFLEGFSLEEVAEVLDTSVSAVKSLQHRGLVQLRRFLLHEESR